METPQIFTIEDEKTKVISLNELSQSLRIEGKLGDKLATKPVQIWKLISKLQELLTQNNLNYHLSDIFVQKRSSAAFLSDYDKDKGYDKYNAPINKWKFDKVIAKLNVPLTGFRDGMNPSIAVSLNDQGLIIAYGMDVHICANFNVMGGTILRTYKHGDIDAKPWELIKMKIERWTQNLPQIYTVQNEIMQSMEQKAISDPRIIDTVIGNLYDKALRQAYFKGDVTPFDTHSLSQFVQQSIRQRKEEEKIANVWDIYNWGTYVMKPDIMDIGEIANNSDLFCKYLCKEFEIDMPIYDAEIVS